MSSFCQEIFSPRLEAHSVIILTTQYWKNDCFLPHKLDQKLEKYLQIIHLPQKKGFIEL